MLSITLFIGYNHGISSFEGGIMKKRWIAFGLCIVFILSLCACAVDKPTEPSSMQESLTVAETEPTTEPETETTTEPTTETTTKALAIAITCDESKQEILAHDATGQMHAIVNKNGYMDSDVKWESSAPAVLEMEEDGTYRAVGIGKTTVTASIETEDESAKRSVVFDVQKLVTGAEFNAQHIEVKAGFGEPIGAKALPEDATDPSIYWGNSNSGVAGIQGNEVRGYREGTCVLTAYNNRGDALGEVSVTVLPGPVYGADAEFGNQIVEYSTHYVTSKTNRVNNLKVAAAAIMAHNGGVILPGEQFSFNGWVGERTYAKGYLDAGVFSGSKEETGLAGGICQVSTTVFNAALLANFRIDQRHPHSMDPQYGKPGQDAAIQWPSVDMKFTNTLDVPVKIVIQIEGGTMTVRLFTPGTDSYALPDVRIEQGGSGLDYWMKRYVNGEVNYSCSTHYVSYHP